MAGDLAAMERERAMVLAGISHDLRTPLSRLRLALEMSGADRTAAEGMGADMEEIDKVIAQFLAFAQRRGRAAGRGRPRRAARGNRRKLRQAGAAGIVPARQACAPFRFAPLAIRRAVSNLVDNALRYAGGAVEVTTRREATRVVVEVLDRGPGVPRGRSSSG